MRTHKKEKRALNIFFKISIKPLFFLYAHKINNCDCNNLLTCFLENNLFRQKQIKSTSRLSECSNNPQIMISWIIRGSARGRKRNGASRGKENCERSESRKAWHTANTTVGITATRQGYKKLDTR